MPAAIHQQYFQTQANHLQAGPEYRQGAAAHRLGEASMQQPTITEAIGSASEDHRYEQTRRVGPAESSA